MLFNSFEYFVFLPSVFLLYFLLPTRFRWLLLLLASYVFYAFWKVEYLILILFSTALDYFIAQKIHQTENAKRRKYWLILSLFSNIGLLSLFKYLGFFTETLNAFLELCNSETTFNSLKLLLPVGISFYTFQSISYTTDVYWKKRKPEKHFGYFALYITFFPQLVAGPIERSSHLIPQLKQSHPIKYENLLIGFRLILWGLFKKMVVADRLAIFVDLVYQNPDLYHGYEILLAVVFFLFQVYFDFSAYSDIAIGSARLFGIKLTQNFNNPLFVTSLRKLWKQWHITLSFWIRDYIYIPLGGNRVVAWRWHYNLMVAFFISGLWHGAAWTFVVWGILQALGVSFEIVTEKLQQKFAKIIGDFSYRKMAWFCTVSFWAFALVFFRSPDFKSLLIIFDNIFDFNQLNINLIQSFFNLRFDLILGFVLSIFVFYIERFWLTYPKLFSEMNSTLRFVLYLFLTMMILFYGVSSQAFVYFQF